MGAMIAFEGLADIARFAEKAGYEIGFTYGCYDYFHAGHREHLVTCRDLLGERTLLVVGIKNDETARLLKGPGRPICPEKIRAMSVAAVPEVDFAVINTEVRMRGMIGLGILEQLRPQYYIVPPHCHLLGVREAVCQRLGIDLIILNRIPPPGYDRISTTEKILAERRSIPVPSTRRGQ